MGMFTRDKAGGGRGGKAAKFSFIGPEVTLTGDIATSGQIHLDGKVTGDICCGLLSQGESGEVRGNIVAGEARLAGLVDGSVEAGTLQLEQSARITGDVLYEMLSISSGAEVEGRFKRRKGAGDGSKGARTGIEPPIALRPHGLFAGASAAAEAAE